MNIPIADYLRLLGTYLREQRGRIAAMGVLLAALTALRLASPQVIRGFIDAATTGAEMAVMVGLAAAYLLLAIGGQTLTVGSRYLSETVAWTATNLLRLDLLRHVLTLDVAFFKRTTPGELMERIDGDVEALNHFFSQFVLNVAGNLLLIAGILVLVTLEQWRIGVALVLYAVLVVVVMSRVQKHGAPRWEALRQQAGEFFGLVGEQMAATEDIRGLGAGEYTMRRLHAAMARWLPVHIRAFIWGGWLRFAHIMMVMIGSAVALGVSVALYQSGDLTIGGVYLVFSYTELLRGPVANLREELERLQQAEAGITRIKRLFAAQSTLPDGDDGDLDTGALALDFDGVSFSYDGDDEWALRGVDFRIAPGESLAILGRTGSGKTTVGRLLSRLYDVTEGAVRLNGRDLRSAPLRDVRRKVGVVTQDVQLFQGTVRDNLTFFNPAVSDAEIRRVLEHLGLRPWLDGLPRGLETELGSGGSGLSAGQAQLLAFARVFLRNPGIVVLDEASSRLDPITESLIEAAVDTLLTGRTAVIIAHRLATVQRADKVLILELGQVVEFGDRKALAADPSSRFAQLLATDAEAVLT